MKLLCLSNGHGEDMIGLRIVQALQRQSAALEVAALPIVGEGHGYRQADIPIAGAVKSMPSGGFIYMDGRQLARDVGGGLVQLTWAQIRTVKAWAKQGGFILAVGDIVPLLFAWMSGANYGFVGTAKSEYYLRDEAGLLPRQSWTARLENWSGSVYLPWERWLMRQGRCQAVFPRDSLTAKVLQQHGIAAHDLGNPMMDGLEPSADFQPATVEHDVQPPLTVLLLPGSRPPEAYDNWQKIIEASTALMRQFASRPLRFLAAIAPALDVAQLRQTLEAANWHLEASGRMTYGQGSHVLELSQTRYADWLHQADLAIAMAGTATEQFVGLGKPAIIMPGAGPQFTPRFAEAQTRLLGPSVILVHQPADVADVVSRLLESPDWLQIISENGRRRLGQPGACDRIATYLLDHCLTD
jgi:uncharacterized protein (TIGR03492 family)